MSIAILRSARLPRCALLLAFASSFTAMSASHAAVEISKKPTQNMICSSGACTPTAKSAVLNVTELAGMLASGSVVLQSGSIAKDIEIDAALSWTSTNRLTLDSYHAIKFNKPVVVAGPGAMTITTNDGGSSGDFRFFNKGHVEFWDLDSSLVINGQSYGLVKNLKQLGLKIRHDGIGHYALVRSINAQRHIYFESPIHNAFAGTFEGLGNRISNLTISASSEEPVGLFSQLGSFTALIRDIGLVSVNISGLGSVNVGALAGSFDSGMIRNSYATGQVTALRLQSGAGGLVGQKSDGTILNSYADVAVSNGDGGIAGGLVGYLVGDCSHQCIGSIDQSYATGTVTGGSSSPVGGLVGSSLGGIITDSYSTGAASGGNSSTVGGLVGSNADNNGVHTGPRISNSYSTGSVAGGSNAVLGGSIGQDIADAQNADLYWDLDTSGISDPTKGAGNITNDPGITGLTDAQLKSTLPAGFDKEVWKLKGTVNNGYPYFIGNPPQ